MGKDINNLGLEVTHITYTHIAQTRTGHSDAGACSPGWETLSSNNSTPWKKDTSL